MHLNSYQSHEYQYMVNMLKLAQYKQVFKSDKCKFDCIDDHISFCSYLLISGTVNSSIDGSSSVQYVVNNELSIC